MWNDDLWNDLSNGDSRDDGPSLGKNNNNHNNNQAGNNNNKNNLGGNNNNNNNNSAGNNNNNNSINNNSNSAGNNNNNNSNGDGYDGNDGNNNPGFNNNQPANSSGSDRWNSGVVGLGGRSQFGRRYLPLNDEVQVITPDESTATAGVGGDGGDGGDGDNGDGGDGGSSDEESEAEAEDSEAEAEAEEDEDDEDDDDSSDYEEYEAAEEIQETQDEEIQETQETTTLKQVQVDTNSTMDHRRPLKTIHPSEFKTWTADKKTVGVFYDAFGYGYICNACLQAGKRWHATFCPKSKNFGLTPEEQKEWWHLERASGPLPKTPTIGQEVLSVEVRYLACVFFMAFVLLRPTHRSIPFSTEN